MITLPSERPLTWLEERIALASEPFRALVKVNVETLLLDIKTHLEDAINAGKDASYTFSTDKITPLARQIVAAQLGTRLTQLGLSVEDRFGTITVHPGYMSEEFRVVLQHSWGDLTDGQFEQVAKHYRKKADPKETQTIT